MGLTLKSKRFLEIIALSGLETLIFAANPKSILYNSVGWSSDRNAGRHLKALSDRGFITCGDERSTGSWVARITEEGKRSAFQEIDPEKSWSQPWDGKWRTISFDLPQGAEKERKQLNNWLKLRRFGHLQGSLWISHRSYHDWTNEIEKRSINPTAVLFQSSSPVGRLTNKEYVLKAWPFQLIQLRYAEYIQFLNRNPIGGLDNSQAWFESESRLWSAAFDTDPFLPNELLPYGYNGKHAWNLRKQTYSQWGEKIVLESNRSPASNVE